jgi:hypothetical protein
LSEFTRRAAWPKTTSGAWEQPRQETKPMKALGAILEQRRRLTIAHFPFAAKYF